MAQVDNFPDFSFTCWAGCVPGITMCDQCLQNAADSTNCVGYIAQSDTRPTTSQNDAAPNHFARLVPNNFHEFDAPFSTNTSERTSSGGSSGSSGPKELTFSEMLHNYTPPTVPESPGRTPAPIATPQDLSFTYHLAYIDDKLVEIAASRRNDTPTEYYSTPRSAKRPAQSDSFAELEQARSSVFASRSAQPAVPRRTHSKVIREQNGHTPPDPQLAIGHELEHDAKRRKLRKNESTSAHTFAVTEPASLRKAKSLVAGDVNQPTVLHPVVNSSNTVALPMIVPDRKSVV